jgi:uncharacterized membrane protein YfcA
MAISIGENQELIPVKRFRYVTPLMLILTSVFVITFIFAFKNPEEIVSRNWPLLIVGILGALIGNLTSIGGGLVFIPVMIFVYHVDPVSSLKLAFVSQAFGMTSGASGWFARKEVPMKLLWWTVPSLIIGTLISSFIFHPSPLLVKGLFGPIAILTGIFTLITLNRKGITHELPKSAMVPVFIISIIGGLITGWVAIGEGEIIAAFCMIAYGLNANKSIGLGVFLLSINSILLACLHAFYFGGVPWEMAIFTMLGCMWGGRLGPFIAQWIPMKGLKRVFAIIALADGMLITFTVLRSYFKW